jgi:hypothetical protein
MAKAVAIVSEGSKPLKNNLHERYARHRAAAQPRLIAFRKAGYIAKNDHVADANSFRLERKPGVRARIEYLARRAEDLIAEKRARIEEFLWSVHEADLADYFETYSAIERDHTGQSKHDENGALLLETRERPKMLEDLPPEARKLVEDVVPDGRGRLIPKLYSKMQASKELRSMLNLNAKSDAADVTKLSDQELLQTLAQQARELGIEIDLNYSFAQPKKPDE